MRGTETRPEREGKGGSGVTEGAGGGRSYVRLAAPITAGLLVLALAVHPWWLEALGWYLVARDPLREADAIVVLQGSVPDRIIKGVELYREGWAPEILMVEARDFSDYQLLEEWELELCGRSRANLQAARQLGVPPGDVRLLPGRVDSTWEEALVLGDYLKEQEGDCIILVTSAYHSRRARGTLDRVLGPEVQVISRPSPYDPFDPESWWRDRRQSRQLLLEYQKMLNLWLFQR